MSLDPKNPLSSAIDRIVAGDQPSAVINDWEALAMPGGGWGPTMRTHYYDGLARELERRGHQRHANRVLNAGFREGLRDLAWPLLRNAVDARDIHGMANVFAGLQTGVKMSSDVRRRVATAYNQVKDAAISRPEPSRAAGLATALKMTPAYDEVLIALNAVRKFGGPSVWLWQKVVEKVATRNAAKRESQRAISEPTISSIYESDTAAPGILSAGTARFIVRETDRIASSSIDRTPIPTRPEVAASGIDTTQPSAEIDIS